MAIYEITTTGVDTAGRNGSSGQPWATMQYAATRMVPGDSTLLHNGTYNQYFINPGLTGTSFSNAYTFAAYPGETPIIAPTGLTGYTINFSDNTRYVIFSGLTISGVGTTYGAVHLDAYDVGFGNPGKIRFDSCEVYSTTTSVWTSTFKNVLLITGATSGLLGGSEILNCYLHLGTAYACYVSQPYTVLQGNDCTDVNYGGLHISATEVPNLPGCVVWGNFVHDIVNSYDGRFFGVINGSGAPSGTQFINNVIWNIGGSDDANSGLTIYKGINALVYNNTVTQCSGGGVAITTSGASGTQVINNISYLNTFSNYRNDGVSTTHTTNIDNGTNPVFANPSADDFSLGGTSPAINAGTTLAAVPTDVTGLPRPQGSAYCIGAYEFVGGGGVWTHIGSSTGASGDTVAATTGAVNTTGANLLIVNVGYYSGISATITVTDSKSNTWTALTVRTNASDISNRIYYCAGTPTVGAGHTVTVTGGGAVYPSLEFDAWAGADSSPFGGQSAGGTGISLSTLQTGSVTPSVDSALLIAGVGWDGIDGSTNATINLGFAASIVPYGPGANEASGIAYLVLPTAAAKNPTWTFTDTLPDGASASLAWFSPSPTTIDLTCSSAVATWQVGAVTLTKGVATITCGTPKATWNVPAVSLTLGTVSLTCASCVATWMVPTATLQVGPMTGGLNAALQSWPRRM